MISRERLEHILTGLSGLKIGLVGDLFLDRYLEIAPDVHELSIETGLEAYQVERIRNAPGAMGTVINNLAALGVGKMIPVTVIGDDGHGDDLLRELKRLPVDIRHIVRDSNRLTPTYTKPLLPQPGAPPQELHRLDVRTRGPLSTVTQAALVAELERAWCECDGLIVLDQIVEADWGVINAGVRQALLGLTRATPSKLMYVDSRAHLAQFGAGILKGNRSEISAAALVSSTVEADIAATASRLSNSTGRTVFCTCGEAGIHVTSPGHTPRIVPGYRVTGPVDIVGAGDAATAGIVSALLCGGTDEEAATLGNLTASITVQQLGATGTASPDQIRARWAEYNAQLRP